MDIKCGKCSRAIGDAEYVYCNGFCDAVCEFHTQCTGLNEKELDACKNANVFWMCERCRFLLDSARFRSTINSLDAVHYMQQKEYNKTVDDLKETITHLNDSISSLLELKKLETINESRIDVPGPANSGSPLSFTQKETASESKIDVPTNSGAPLSSTRIENPATICSEQRSGTFKVFLSNIDRRVTEADISELVSSRVGTRKPFNVKRLVPAWKQVADMEYISFKVELDILERKKALSPGCWPPGMRYREFREDRNRNVPWSPRQYGRLYRHNENTV